MYEQYIDTVFLSGSA